MGRAFCELQRGFASRFLILGLLLLASLVNSSSQLVVLPLETSGCKISKIVHFDSHEDPPSSSNTKNLKCTNISIDNVNQEYFKSDSDVAFKEITLQQIVYGQERDYLNVINEQQTEILKLVDSQTTDEQLKKIFQNKKFIRLRSLDVSGNRIESPDKETFRALVRLRSLNLARNVIEVLKGDVFLDLHDLNELYLSNNKFTDFSASFDVFSNLKQLTLLDLSNNTIQHVGRNIFYGLQNLIEINMSHNKLYVLPFQVFESMISIEKIDLSHNLLMTFLDNFFIHNGKLKVLQLHNNRMAQINKNSLYGLKELHTLDLSYNQLLTVDRNAFDTLDGLKLLNLANNNIQLLSANVFLSLKRLHSLDLSNNGMEKLPLGIFAHQYQLTELSMDNTNIVNLSNWITKLNTNATISKFVLKNLKFISLKNSTRLRNVESCWLQNMPSVEKLYITNSQVTFLPKGIDEITGLVELDLFNNQLEFIPQGIKHLTDLRSLNLLGNDLHCDCHMYWMLNWIDELKTKNKTLPYDLLRLSELKCRNGYPGDIIRVLQHINCVRPYLISATKEQTYNLFTDAVLECSFAGTPGPEIIWRTPQGEILRHDEKKEDTTAKFQLKQLHKSVLPEDLNYWEILDSAMNSEKKGTGIMLLENGTLTVHNISRADSGLYSCFAVNIMGNATTDVR